MRPLPQALLHLDHQRPAGAITFNESTRFKKHEDLNVGMRSLDPHIYGTTKAGILMSTYTGAL